MILVHTLKNTNYNIIPTIYSVQELYKYYYPILYWKYQCKEDIIDHYFTDEEMEVQRDRFARCPTSNGRAKIYTCDYKVIAFKPCFILLLFNYKFLNLWWLEVSMVLHL